VPLSIVTCAHIALHGEQPFASQARTRYSNSDVSRVVRVKPIRVAVVP